MAPAAAGSAASSGQSELDADTERTPLLNAINMDIDKHVGVDIEPPPHDLPGEASGSRIEEADFVTRNEEHDLSRGLKQRHISLIAIAGAIGTGLFLGLGGSIQTAGPLGALLGYMTVGLIVCCVQFALGEVTALLPVTGSFVRHAEFLVDPALGFAIGWVSEPLSLPEDLLGVALQYRPVASR